MCFRQFLLLVVVNFFLFLSNLLIINKFKPIFINRYIDSDYLLVIAKKIDKIETKKINLDDYKKVKNFFEAWFKESKKYNKEII